MENRGADWLKKLTGGKQNVWLTGVLAGLLLLVIAIPSGKTSEERTGAESAGLEKTADKTEEYGLWENARQMEKRLESVLGQVEGVGEVKVMITFQSSGEKIVEKDWRNSQSESEQTQEGQGAGNSRTEEKEEVTVYERGENGGEAPYVKEVMEPQVEGVLVAAEGGGNSVTAANITEAVMALFDIEAHKIKVMKKQS